MILEVLQFVVTLCDAYQIIFDGPQLFLDLRQCGGTVYECNVVEVGQAVTGRECCALEPMLIDGFEKVPTVVACPN